MRAALSILGLVMVAMGLLWVGQGTGLIMWPAQSFMLAQSQWAYNGAGLAVAGAALIVLGRRKRG